MTTERDVGSSDSTCSGLPIVAVVPPVPMRRVCMSVPPLLALREHPRATTAGSVTEEVETSLLAQVSSEAEREESRRVDQPLTKAVRCFGASIVLVCVKGSPTLLAEAQAKASLSASASRGQRRH